MCTIGPASVDPKVMEKLVKAGMNCVRINTAYGNLDFYKSIIENVREVDEIPVLVDLKGPEIRLRTKEKIIVSEGEVLEVGFGRGQISFNHNFIAQLNAGDMIYIDNGKIRTTVLGKAKGKVRLLIEQGGVISDGKGVNIPKKQLPVPTLSARDLEIIRLAQELNVEFVALSFTRNTKDINELKIAAKDFEGAVIAKIENFEGIRNFDQILRSADGIMIARGDLGVEIETEKVPLVQKSLIRRCNQVGKPVVTATEMLESMMHQPFPTRAEVSDVANAILDGTDATMLSGETAVGKHPIESVSMMARIALETERATASSIEERGFINISDTVSRSIQRICHNMPLNKIVTLTRSGYTAKMIARFRVPQAIIAVTSSPIVKKQLELVYGVIPVYIDYSKEKDRIMTVACKLSSMNLLDVKDTVLFTAAFRTKERHASNLIEIHHIKELLEFNKM